MLLYALGLTSDIVKRIYEHKNSITKSFSARYSCKSLVFYELHDSMDSAITIEKQIKAGSRKKKLQLIESINPEWKDLYDTII